MTKTDGECCAKPVCDFTTQQGSFTGTGSVSGKGVGMHQMVVESKLAHFYFKKNLLNIC